MAKGVQEMDSPYVERQNMSVEDSPTSWKRTLSIRRDPKAANLRDMYRDSASNLYYLPEETLPKSEFSSPQNAPHLPPTPPTADQNETHNTTEQESSELNHLRSDLVTPPNHNRPPTPDKTPPHFRDQSHLPIYLGAKPSMASTIAESFRTAREDLTSDDESDLYPKYRTTQPRYHQRLYSNTQSNGSRSQSRFFSQSSLGDKSSQNSRLSTPQLNPPFRPHEVEKIPSLKDEAEVVSKSTSSVSSVETPTKKRPLQTQTVHEQNTPATDAESKMLAAVHRRLLYGIYEGDRLDEIDGPKLRRGVSLRERLMAAQNISNSASVEKFASIIGWSNSVSEENFMQETKRHSGGSMSSTIEAIVLPSPSIPRRATTLRHVPKHGSLRSVSSPLPASNRNSTYSNPESPHRLVHKSAKISNQNRWSFGSEISRNGSLASSAALPRGEIITVAIIPERRSSLSSNGSSRRHSLPGLSPPSKTRKVSEKPPSSWQPRRNFSESISRGRTTEPPYLIPPRSSSLSAPTSRSTSRANSLTSEHIRTQRQVAESDLRQTLDRMESERLVVNLRSLRRVDGIGKGMLPAESPSAPRQKKHSSVNYFSPVMPETPRKPHSYRQRRSTDGSVRGLPHGIEPGTQEWAALRPSSVLDTPFSQPSYLSTSPEIKEARAVNFVSHNPHSLQLIEPFPLEQSSAVTYVRKRPILDAIDSPLRNPRSPPLPPQVKVIPPTPGHEREHHIRHMNGRLPNRRYQSLNRPPAQRSNSLVRSLARNFSLRNTRNRKVDQDLDASLHPFWRPRPFWDDIDPPRYRNRTIRDRSLSRGMSSISGYNTNEKRSSKGPMALIRRFSSRRQAPPRKVIKQTSQSSLSRLRTGRQLHRFSGQGLPVNFLGIRELPEWLTHARQRKEEERWQQRQTDLRQKIGTSVVHQSDSRFPASDTDLARAE